MEDVANSIPADAEPQNITLQKLPSTWTGGPVDDAGNASTGSAQINSGVLELGYGLVISARGPARLEMTAAVAQPPGLDSDIQTGVGLIGAAALMAVLIVYRRIRARLAAVGAIREALLALQGGETTEAALTVDHELR